MPFTPVYIPPPIIYHGGGGAMPASFVIALQILGLMFFGFLIYWTWWAWFKNDGWDKKMMRVMSACVMFIVIIFTWAVVTI